MNLAERRESTTASSAMGVVRKHGKGEGSPCPRGKSGLGSSLLTLPHIFIKSPRTDVFDCGFSFPIPQKFHLFSPFSSIFLLLQALTQMGLPVTVTVRVVLCVVVIFVLYSHQLLFSSSLIHSLLLSLALTT